MVMCSQKNKAGKFCIPLNYQVVEKVVFLRLVKNIQMQGTLNPEE
jgi:hypothetical protein